ncbi:MAG: 30S ribosomal protein S7 [Candidatus Aminicenantes bacterium]|nr:30S ribosomal protein S7 [Candidatus Aminicenantes bacterium]MCK4495647.1 30S ribosomal protein S7 [Candidatus Aminicenantes bacterium]
MPRRGTIKKKKSKPDHYYNSTLVSKFINTIMKKGKKSLAEKIIYEAMERAKQKAKGDPLKMFEKAVENVRPLLETKSRRVGGATYQVPIEVAFNRSTSLAVRWILRYARDRSGKSMIDKLAAEITDAVNNRGGAVKKREDTHRMAEANRAFAHYKW